MQNKKWQTTLKNQVLFSKRKLNFTVSGGSNFFFFLGLSLKNFNYTKFNKNIASYINQKKKKKTPKYIKSYNFFLRILLL